MAKVQTDKQRKLVKLLSENVGLAKPKTMLEMMLEAGYSEETARQQTGILNGIREELDPIVEKLEAHRLKVIDRLAKKLDAATYRDLTDSLDKLTKNIQLLRGKPTERPNNVITGLEHLTDEQLATFIAARIAGNGNSPGGAGATAETKPA
jgi:ParB-like chromosome segregation protein Spo0J